MKQNPELLSLRDYFASCALQAIITQAETISIDPELFSREAGLAYAAADAMLAERAKSKKA